MLVGLAVPQPALGPGLPARAHTGGYDQLLMRRPMSGITPVALASFRQLGSGLGVRTSADSCRAASMRLALSSDVLDLIRDGIGDAGYLDAAALLGPCGAERLSSYPLAFSLALRAAAHRLPREMIEHPWPEAFARRHFGAADAPAALRVWVRRRLSHLIERPAIEGEVELVVVRMGWAFRELLFVLAFAQRFSHLSAHVSGAGWVLVWVQRGWR